MDSMVLWFTVFCLVFSLAEGWFYDKSEVCYGTLGCFNNRYPFTNALGKLPESPEVIDTKFFLFTRTSPTDYVELVPSTLTELKPIKLIIHAYTESAQKQWVKDMVAELLENGDYYVIVVDWSNGTVEPKYLQSVANTRVVGAVVAQLLKTLRDENGIDPTNMHIIGYGLGAHVAGYAGENFENISRISGLDPAGPAFQFARPIVRLDPTDASFVDVIHTNGKLLGLGIKKSVGTVDFYPNGGKAQPGCPEFSDIVTDLLNDADLQGAIDDLFCSHQRSVEFFIESINTMCLFNGYPCPDLTTSSSCNSCGTGCHRMGFHASSSMNPGQFYLQTNSVEPYCIIDNSYDG
ncbi:pancreatic triacylglycerol lipase-like [Mercenaria mercenaria]|uniref:pancreatic triacylglycerol lipase-like n=1 Tax=Mercenaria mercenaria TaxID=6596 RepID=UPI00234F92E7|nr:pancreatic triacylglycerol lipase-like [Mercenaria mercenaria]XP_053394971.1 pancreatic triacylglycerol lipase-like [Mercenaria mercenaria]